TVEGRELTVEKGETIDLSGLKGTVQVVAEIVRK
ncbi:MAG: hypothetical protein QOE14_1268, partial [Humisphaera sp.]|nr:hypothetical protein [Humisphaera sp.]